MKLLTSLILLLLAVNNLFSKPSDISISSPDNKITVIVGLNAQGTAVYSVKYTDSLVIRPSLLGLKLKEADFSQKLKISDQGKIESVNDNYTLLSNKRKVCTYNANKRTIKFSSNNTFNFSVEFRVSNDGVGFRYLMDGNAAGIKHIDTELTTFHFPAGAKGWLHPHAVAQTGWSNTQPSYEEYYKMGIPVGTESTLGQGWSFPALFQSAGCWVLVSETDVFRNYCGSHLSHLSPNGEYSIAFPQAPEKTTENSALYPESQLPWVTPWRIMVIGQTLAPIVESTLTTDLASPSVITDYSFVKPGKSSWSWVLKGDNQTIYPVEKTFIDYASTMKWNYCLIDGYWDKQIGYDSIQDLCNYAKQKNVGLLLWYNSNGNWNKAPQTPRGKTFDPQIRSAEFEKLSKMGIKGLKIDFFGGDGQSMLSYYQDLLESAAKYGLIVNFHGSTIPRGWTRTYPNLVNMEAVRGFEFLTFEQANTNEEPTHCAVLPFTRNAIAPMDFTPVCFGEIPHRNRLTNNGFEIALSVIFQAGVQHYAEIPERMYQQPDYVQDFMRNLPLTWDDVKFIDGYPGEFAVIARKGNGKWYIAGINGTKSAKHIRLNLKNMDGITGGTVITDGDTNRTFSQYEVNNTDVDIEMKPYGGFVLEGK
jgi:alpha-glucosidase